MIDPEYLVRVVLGTEKAVAKLNNAIIKQIARRLSDMFYRNRLDQYSPSAISDLYKIVQSGYSVSEVQQLVEKELPGIQKEIRKAFEDSASEIAKYNDNYTRLVGDSVGVDVPLKDGRNIDKMTKQERIILENAYSRTNATVRNMTKTTASNAYMEYIQGCDDAYMKVRSGMSMNKAISQTIDDLAKRGITQIQYRSGRTDSIEVAVARSVRTGINQANSEIILQRCASLGIGYVKVSQHLGARVTKKDDYTNHSWWQGKIYKLDWSNGALAKYGNVNVIEPKYRFIDKIKLKLLGKDVYNYPDFVDTCGYGNIEGIIGINCRHTFQMWQPGINKITDKPINKKENEKRYTLEQKQRSMEREMRKTRRRIEAQKALSQTEESKYTLDWLNDLLKKQGKRYADFCKENNLQADYQRTRIGVV